MRKTLGSLCALVLVVGVMVAVQRSSHAAPLTHPQVPKIIAKVALTGQTAAIPQTEIFTPTRTALYRVSFYMTVTQPGNAQSYWIPRFFWSDDAGIQVFNAPILLQNSTVDSSYNNQTIGGPGDTMLFEAVAGVPVRYAIGTDPGPSGTYSIYITAELLE